ncbi:hypothetical protein [Demequina silvatica]|uniref:hypothetical protein n=1 Tax=Demequina silvatica TaxID=1638988 RepID=UPI00078409D7|nr:hypothetical protein [Demequina silvatica]
MSAEIRPRRGAAERVTGIIWGAIVAATGALTIAALSGYDVDLEVLAIVALVVLGGWLLASALAAASRQSRQERAAFVGTDGAAGTAGDDAPVAAVDEVGAPEGSGSPLAGEAPLAPTAEMPVPRSQTAGHTWAEPAQRWDETADTEVIAAESASDTPDTPDPDTADGERRTDQ